MTYCTKCGAQVPETARFCQVCGEPQAGTGTAPATPTPVPQAQTGLSENAAALLSYVLGWLTGIIFYLIDHRPYVRYHAAQSIVTFGGLHIIRAIVAIVFGVGWWWGGGFGMHWGGGLLILWGLGLLTLVLWIYCMIKAYQGERFKLPIAGEIAEGLLR
ncbi:MAG TPA: zinc-ribbon domain-containing protein [Terriglobales bacterium]|nr:zinc-ribbon domain-containing protein [Terriglobales bacterium]